MIAMMAFRNIGRHKKRTLLTLVTIIAGIFFSIFGDGLNAGLKWQLADIYIKTDTSNFKIYGKGFWDNEEKRNPLDYLFSAEKVDLLLKNSENITGYSKRLVFNGSITNGRDELRVKYIGINPKEEDVIFARNQQIVSGTYLTSDDGEEIIVGKEAAAILNIKAGDSVTIIGRTKNNSINAYDVKIKGIIKTTNPVVDSGVVFLPIKFAKKFADTELINDVAVSTNGFKEISRVKKIILPFEKEAGKNGLEIVGWYDETKDLLGMVEFRAKIFSLITIAILIMAAAGVANTMLMAMLERKREIGIMMANGMEERDILKLFLLEGVIIGAIGSGIALILGSILVKYFEINGIKIPLSQNQIGEDFPVSEKLYLYLDYGKALFYFMLGIVVTAIAALYPAKKSTKLEPIEAIKG